MTVQISSSSGADQASANGVYCYGITWATAAPPRGEGVGGKVVAAVRDGELAALTSPVESTKVRAKRRDLLNQYEVLAAALERGTGLKIRFGDVLENEADIDVGFIRSRQTTLAV